MQALTRLLIGAAAFALASPIMAEDSSDPIIIPTHNWSS
jgi:glycine betaine/proline transport system substrate-binding protein